MPSAKREYGLLFCLAELIFGKPDYTPKAARGLGTLFTTTDKSKSDSKDEKSEEEAQKDKKEEPDSPFWKEKMNFASKLSYITWSTMVVLFFHAFTAGGIILIVLGALRLGKKDAEETGNGMSLISSGIVLFGYQLLQSPMFMVLYLLPAVDKGRNSRPFCQQFCLEVFFMPITLLVFIIWPLIVIISTFTVVGLLIFVILMIVCYLFFVSGPIGHCAWLIWYFLKMKRKTSSQVVPINEIESEQELAMLEEIEKNETR